MHFDYVTFIIPALFVLIGGGLFRVGLHLKGESPQGARRAWLFIALGIVFGVAAVLTAEGNEDGSIRLKPPRTG